MSQRKSAAEIYRAYNAAENDHDLFRTTSLLAESLTVQVNGINQVSSADEDKDAMELLYMIYPDYRREIVRIIDAGDEATIIWRMRGTPRVNHGEHLQLNVEGVSVVTSNGFLLTHASLFVNSVALDQTLALAQEAKNR